MKISVRLAIAFGIMLVGIFTLVVVGTVMNLRMGATVEKLVNERYPVIVTTASFRGLVSDNQARVQEIASVTDKSQVEARVFDLPDLARGMESFFTQLDAAAEGTESKSLLAQTKEAGKVYLAARDKFVKQAKQQPGSAATAEAFQQTKTAHARLTEQIGAFTQAEGMAVSEAGDEAARDSRRMLWLMGILGGGGVLLVVAVGITITRNLLTQLGGEPRYAADVATRIASGDLSNEVMTRAGDARGLLHTMKAMQADLRQMIAQVRHSTEAVSTASVHLVASAREVSEASDRQTRMASVTTTAVGQMVASVNQMVQSAAQTHQNSTEASQLAEQGEQLVQEASAEMAKIAQTVDTSSQEIRALMARADEIGYIVKVIQEIAEQTNLLALNAAIEAARAGEQGRGFAVVADEIRKLAERTGTSTTKITEMIGSIQTETQNAANSMEQSGKLVQNGVQLADQAAESLQRINARARDTLLQIEEVVAAADAQRNVSNEICRHIEQIAGMAHAANATVGRSAEAAGQLESLAATLSAAVSRFNITERSTHYSVGSL